MATVRVKGFSVIRDVLGAGEGEIEVGRPETVKATLDALLQTYGEQRTRRQIDLLVQLVQELEKKKNHDDAA